MLTGVDHQEHSRGVHGPLCPAALGVGQDTLLPVLLPESPPLLAKALGEGCLSPLFLVIYWWHFHTHATAMTFLSS